MRGRSYSLSPSPPPYTHRGGGRMGYSSRRGSGRSPSPPPSHRERRDRFYTRDRDRDRNIDLPTSLLVRNLRHDCRPEDLRRPFSQFGPLKDIYLPKDYYTGEPRGFGFVQFVDPADAADAKHHMDGQVLLGRELTVVFAEENRKKPTEMRTRERGGRFNDRRRSPRYSRSPPLRHRSRSRTRDYYSPPPKQREYSRSVSPEERRYSRERSYSPQKKERSYSRSTPPLNGSVSRSRSQSPAKCPSSRSRSPTPNRDDRESAHGGRSPSP
ncbi:hypothetical protein Lal_00003565 [Lupinus albus]|uniref:Putative RNA recognition motif domain-containing protein n=1 Tax=Lupinus albus TaxID=3870 RepID=A0A6A4Q3C2_LUPAL|nr:putative RNA recognition motif domain-containing protein [Lupinus albus]KAF1870359.1 hypothetical protein Lal_00003565 [Lupinus albus]